MPNYLIISNTTVVDSNTDVYGRIFRGTNQLLIGNTSVFSTLTSTTFGVSSITSNTINTTTLGAATSLTVGNATVQVGITGTGISTTGSMVAANLTLNNQLTLGSVSVQNGTIAVGNTRVTNTSLSTTSLSVTSQITAGSISGVGTLQASNISSQVVNTSIVNVTSNITIGGIGIQPTRFIFNGGVDHLWKTNTGNYFVQQIVDAADNFSTNLYNASGAYYGTAHYFKVASNTMPLWNILLPTSFSSSMVVGGATTINNSLNVTGGTTTSTLVVNQSSVHNGTSEFKTNVNIKNDLRVNNETVGSAKTGYIYFGNGAAALLYNGTDFSFNSGSLTVATNFVSGNLVQSPNIWALGGELWTHQNNNTGTIFLGNQKTTYFRFDGSNVGTNRDLYLPSLYASSVVNAPNIIVTGGSLTTHQNSPSGFINFGNNTSATIYSDGNNLVYNSYGTSHYFNGTVYANSLVQASDKRLKNLNKYLEDSEGLNYIMKMNPLSFSWKDDKEQRPVMGFFAQELQEILPDVVTTTKDGNLSVDLMQIIPLLVSSIKHLKEEINTIKNV